MTAVVSLSGGVGSWAAARRWVDTHGTEDLQLLFADTLIEDEDLYRFLGGIESDLGLPITRIADGRTPWEVFKDERMIGNTRIDPCSKILKRKILHHWVDNNTEGPITLLVGIDFTEDHRLPRIAHEWEQKGHKVEAPLCWDPVWHKADSIKMLNDRGIKPPRLYDLGFPHNNCGGFCVKAGQAQFVNLMRKFPARYAEHEQLEQGMREYLGKDVAILRDRRGGTTKPMTLKAFRERVEADPSAFDRHDWGACSCMAPTPGEGGADE